MKFLGKRGDNSPKSDERGPKPGGAYPGPVGKVMTTVTMPDGRKVTSMRGDALDRALGRKK